MLNHPLDKRLRKLANPWRCRTEFPKIVNLFGSFTALKVAPEMILNRCFACSPSFAHKLFPAKFRHDPRDFHCCPRGLDSAVDSTFQAALSRLVLIVEVNHDVDYRHAVINGNSLKEIGHEAAQL